MTGFKQNNNSVRHLLGTEASTSTFADVDALQLECSTALLERMLVSQVSFPYSTGSQARTARLEERTSREQAVVQTLLILVHPLKSPYSVSDRWTEPCKGLNRFHGQDQAPQT